MGWFASLFLGASLAACTGLRAFLPLVSLALISRYGIVGHYALPEDLQWLQSDRALAALAALAVLEVAADKVRLVAAFFDPVLVLLRPGAGVLACLSVLNLPTMTANLVAALVVGLTLSLPMMSLKNAARLRAARRDREFGEPGASFAEDLLAGLGPLAAFFSPVLVFLALLAGGFHLLTRNAADVPEEAVPEEEAETAPPPPTGGFGPPTPGMRRPE